MRMDRLHTACVAFLIVSVWRLPSAFGQIQETWPPVSKEELALKNNPDEPGSAAMIPKRQIYTDDEKRLQTEWIRIKAFTDMGKSYADIQIPYLGRSTSIEDIRGRTVRTDGTVIPFNGTVFDNVLLKYRRYEAKVFTLPGVEAGISGSPGDAKQAAPVTVTKNPANSPFALPRVPLGYGALARIDSQVPCQSIWVGSEDPWINSHRVVGWINTAPDFVSSGIAISPEASHADLTVQFEQSMDGDGKILHLLNVSSWKANLWDQTTLRPSEYETDADYEQDADYEEAIARITLRAVLAHCVLPPRGGESETQALSETANQQLLAPETAKEKILASRILRPVVQTSFMRDKVLLSALKFRPEFGNWGMKICVNDDRTDLDLVVGHELSTLTWTYQLVDHATGELLDQGTVVAFTDTHAASRIVELTVNRIAEWRVRTREHPAPTTRLKATPPVFVFPGPQTWEVEVDSADRSRQYPSKMRLSVKEGNLVFSDQVGTAVFSIPGEQILDFVDAKDFSILADSFHSHGDDAKAVLDSCAWAEEGAGFCVALGLAGLLASVAVETPLNALRGPQHAFDIAWSDNNSVRVDSLRVSKGNYRTLRWILDALSKDPIRDLPSTFRGTQSTPESVSYH